MQIQAPDGILHCVCDQLAGSYGIFEKQGFKKLHLVFLAAVWVGQSPAAKPKGQNGAVNHPCRDLVSIFIAQRIECLIDAGGEKAGDKLCLHPVETDSSRLVELGGLLFFVFHQQKGIDIILQLGVETVIVGSGMVNIIFYPSVHIGMANGIPNVVAEKTAHKSKPLLPLLAGINPGKLVKAAAEKIVYMVLMHVGSHVPVIPVAQDGQVVEEHIRTLEAKLVEPSVLGDNEF